MALKGKSGKKLSNYSSGGSKNSLRTYQKHNCSKSSANLWQVYEQGQPARYENSLPSSLRNRRGSRRYYEHSSAKRCSADNNNATTKKRPIPAGALVTSSMIAHADSGSSDLSSDSPGEDQDRSVTTSESGDGTEVDDSLEERMIFQSVVVYIGAVPVPHLSLSRRHVIRGALQSLRAQRAKARTVLLQIFDDQVVVTNSRGCITHRLLVSRIAFASACAENKQYFGLCIIHPQPPLGDQTISTTSPDSSKSSTENTNQFLTGNNFSHAAAAVGDLDLAEKTLVTVFDDKMVLLDKVEEENLVPPAACENGRILTEAQIHFEPDANRVESPIFDDENDGYEVPNHRRIVEELKELVKETSPEAQRVFEGKTKMEGGSGYSSLTRMKSLGATGRNLMSSFRKQISVDQMTTSTYPRTPKNLPADENRCPDTHFGRTMSNQELAVLQKENSSNCSAKNSRNLDRLVSSAEPNSISSTSSGPPLSAPPVVDSGRTQAQGAAAVALAEPEKTLFDAGDGEENAEHFFVNDEAATMALAAGVSGSCRTTKTAGEKVTKTPSVPEFDQMLADASQRKPFERSQLGKRLFENHFSEGCLEPVNVDSSAMHLIQRAVETNDFPPNLYDGPQYQIYHLMKYDCWPRFLKSEFSGKRSAGKGGNTDEENSNRLSNLIGADAERSSSVVSLTTVGSGHTQGGSEKQSKRKSLIPWKGKFIASRRKKNVGDGNVASIREQDLTTGAAERGRDSEASSVRSGAAALTGTAVTAVTPTESSGAGGRISFAGGRKKMEWKKAGKQLSVPAEFLTGTQSSNVGSVASPKGSVSARQPQQPAQDRLDEVESVNAAEGDMEIEATTSMEPKEKCCIAILPGGARTTVQLPENMTVRQWLNSLASRHGFNPAGTELYDQNTGDKIDFTGVANRTLADRIVRLETSVLFKLELPLNASSSQDGQLATSGENAKHRKLVAIRARSEHPAGLVLRPVLARYGLDLDKLVICLSGTTEVLPNSAQIRRADNRKLLVLSHQEFQDWVHSDHAPGSSGANSPALPGCSAQSSTGSSTASTPSDVFGEHGPTFQELPPSGNSSVTVGIAELPPKRRKAKAALPAESGVNNEEKGGGDSAAISGMLKFVRNKSNTVQVASGSCSPNNNGQQSLLSPQEKPPDLIRNTLPPTSAGISPKLARKSVGPLALLGTAGTSSGAERQEGVAAAPREIKRQTLASARELKEQMKQDKALAELWTRAQSTRIDDQRGTSPMTYDLPDFLKDANVVCQRGGGGGEICGAGQKENIFDKNDFPENNRDFADDFVLPTAEEAEAVFGQVGESLGLGFKDFSDPNLTERKSLADYGFLESSDSTSTTSNVSVVRICDDRTATPHVTARVASLKCRPPPPPYQGAMAGKTLPGPPAALVVSSSMNAGSGAPRNRTPLYVPPSSFNAPVVSKDHLSSDIWQVDYV